MVVKLFHSILLYSEVNGLALRRLMTKPGSPQLLALKSWAPAPVFPWTQELLHQTLWLPHQPPAGGGAAGHQEHQHFTMHQSPPTRCHQSSPESMVNGCLWPVSLLLGPAPVVAPQVPAGSGVALAYWSVDPQLRTGGPEAARGRTTTNQPVSTPTRFRRPPRSVDHWVPSPTRSHDLTVQPSSIGKWILLPLGSYLLGPTHL